MPPVFCSAPDLTLEELEAELGLIGSAKQILAAIAVQARLRGLVAKRRAREAALSTPTEMEKKPVKTKKKRLSLSRSPSAGA